MEQKKRKFKYSKKKINSYNNMPSFNKNTNESKEKKNVNLK